MVLVEAGAVNSRGLTAALQLDPPFSTADRCWQQSQKHSDVPLSTRLKSRSKMPVRVSESCYPCRDREDRPRHWGTYQLPQAQDTEETSLESLRKKLNKNSNSNCSLSGIPTDHYYNVISNIAIL